VDVGRLDGDVADESGPGRLLHGQGEGQRVPAPEHVGPERVLVGVVEGDAGRAVDDVGQVRPQAGQLLRFDAQIRLLDVARDETELLHLGRREVQPLEEERAALGRREDLEDLLRLVVADGLRPHDGDDLLDAAIVGGLGEDLLAQESGGTREQHAQPRAAAARAQERARLALEPLDAGLHFLLAQMRELAELEGDVAVHDTHHLLGQVLDGGIAHGRARHLRRAFTERV
jgi:hypothetical protein